MTPASIIPVFGSQRPYADLNFAGGSFGLDGRSVSDLTALPGFTFTRASTAMFYGSNGLLQTAASGVARLVYDPVTLASQGILVEEARTNLALQSQTFGTTWTQTSITVGDNVAASPDGTSNADGIVEDGTSNPHRVSQAVSVVSGTAYTLSVFVKVANVNFIQLVFGTPTYFPAGNGAWFNVSTGVVVSTGTSTTSTITSVGNGWYRCGITVTAVGTGSVNFFLNPSDNSSSATYTGTNGRTSVYLWQAQLEAGTGASSPVPTTTAAVTRAADVPVLTGLSVPDGSTLVLEGRVPAFITTDARTGISTNDNANRTWFVYNGTTLTANVTVAGGSVGVLATAVSANAAFKAAVATSGGAYRAAINGGAVGTGSGAASATMTQADIGTGVGGSSRYWNNTISRIRIYNRALPDAQLQSLTT